MWRTLAQIGKGPLARDGLKSMAVQIAAIVLGLGQAVILARTLGPTDYGVFATAAGVSAILAAIAVGGFDQYAVRELSRLRVDGDLRTALAFIRFGNRSTLAASLLAGGGLAAVAGVYAGADAGWRTTFMLAGAATPLATLLLLRAGQLRGLGAVVVAQIPVAVARPGAMIVLLGAFWLAGLPMDAPRGMTAWLLACVAALVLASAVLYLRSSALNAGRPAPALTRKWLLDAAPFFGSTVVGIVFGQVNTLMLATLDGPQAAGLFQPIAYVVPVLALPIGALAMPLAPRIVELWRQGDGGTLRRITWMYTAATFAGTSAIGIAVLLLGAYMFSFFGPEFVSAAPALGWIVAAQILFAALGPSEILLAMTGMQRIVLAAQTVALVITISLSALLIPRWGIHGAAIGLAIGIVAGRLTTTIVALRHMQFDTSLVGALLSEVRRANAD